MPFGLTNTPSTFMRLINHALRSFIGKFIVLYFNDILIYSKSINEHIKHLKQVIDAIRAEKLYTKLKKFTFCMDCIIFLGYLVSTNGIEVDQEKVKVIREWSRPISVLR